MPAFAETGARLSPPLSRVQLSLRRRQVLILSLQWLPLIALFITAARKLATTAEVLACLALLLLAWALYTGYSLRKLDTASLLRAVHSALPALEDSLDLLFVQPVHGLAKLQRVRIAERLERALLPDLRRPIPWRRIGMGWSIGAAIFLPLLWLPLSRHRAGTTVPGSVLGAALQINPPAYTHLPSRRVDSLDANVAAGSRVEFRLRLDARVASAALLFEDGTKLVLQHNAEWRAVRTLSTSTLYRLQLDSSAELQALHRIDVIPDQAPRLIVNEPRQTLNLVAPQQKFWELEFEASDDYGLAAAELSLSLAQGTGENIKTSQQTLVLEGDGGDLHRVYRKHLDLTQLGFALGDDLIVRFSVTDNHPATPNKTQSASYILRWPAAAEPISEGMEGLVQKTLPAYFSSERQLIIDTEALIAERANIAPSKLAQRADELGVQQKMLRLRYGQFLGEEFESYAEQEAPPKFGDVGSITTDFGHVHDKPGAATLFDTDTRRILKSALDEMWQAELQLRQAQLDAALPYEYKALAYIKEVQQAERIYLARVGVALPENDAARRLTGERGGLSDRDGRVPAADPAAAEARQIWESLNGPSPRWSALEQWIAQHRSSLPDALSVLAAIDRAQRSAAGGMDCAACRNEVANRLWPLLPTPSTALEPRRLPSAAGQTYLDALP